MQKNLVTFCSWVFHVGFSSKKHLPNLQITKYILGKKPKKYMMGLTFLLSQTIFAELIINIANYDEFMTWMILLTTTTLSAMASCFEQVVFVVYMHVFRFCWPEAIKKLFCYVIPFKTLEINISVKKILFWFTVVL